MTLKDIIRNIERIAKAQPPIKTIVPNDVFKLSQNASARYGVFSYTQLSHRGGVNDMWKTYNFRLFYVDRLTNDESNITDIQSEGVEILDNIIRQLADVDGIEVGSYTFTPFTQRFADLCAGVYVEVSVMALRDNGECFEGYTTATRVALYTKDGKAVYDGNDARLYARVPNYWQTN